MTSMIKRHSSKRAFALIALATSAMALAACNTVQGLGEDIESVGRKGEEVIS
ncbi:MAG: hypothetical protein AAF251_13425 [Pseudomonadota bacterium]